MPAALLHSPRDTFPGGEASLLRGDDRHRVSYVTYCDYEVKSPHPLPGGCAEFTKRIQQLPAAGPVVFLATPPDPVLRLPGIRYEPGRYLRLTYAGGVVSRVSRLFRLPHHLELGDVESEYPIARFYDETDHPATTFKKLNNP